MNHYLIYLYRGQVIHIDNWTSKDSDPIGRDIVFDAAVKKLVDSTGAFALSEATQNPLGIYDEVQKLDCFSA